MKIDTNKALVGLDGQKIKDTNIGKTLATHLANTGKGDAIKLIGWAMKLYVGEVIDIDKSDQGTLKAFIKDSETITNLCKAQLLDCFEEKK